MTFLGGDFRFFYPENIKDFITLPLAWDSSLNTGIGHSQIGSLWIISYFNLTVFLSKLGLNWNLIQLIFWVLPAILLSFLSSFYLFKALFNFKDRYSILAGIIYTFNTYFLMILTGGQLGVSLSYSITPLVLLGFIKLVRNPSFKNVLISGLTLGLQIIFDPRIVYITLVATFFYSVFNFSDIKRVIKNSPVFFTLPLVIAILMNIFWILPLILTKSSPIPEGFNSAKSFEFFSFADFSHSLSLLHPNWPENIFGKIYFLDPKFLILPLVAFSSLLFVKNKIILYFSALSLLGIFLAKGANLPLGQINTWLFQSLPGMSMFRDPTKWYLLIVLGYSILIPYSLKKLSKYFKLAPILFVLYFLYLISPVFEQIKISQVPQEYIQLKNFLDNQKTFSRTLWIPSWQRFGYFSNNHPAIGREEVIRGNAKKQIAELNENLLKELSIKYVIVPYDSQGEIFLKDRKYNDKEYEQTIGGLRKLSWLKDVGGFGKIHVFELNSPKDHFFIETSDKEKVKRVNYQIVKPTEYKVQVKNAKKGDLLVFSEGFDKNWTAEGSKFKVKSSKFGNNLNRFVLPEDGNYELKVTYAPQKYVEAGLGISLIVILSSIIYLLFGKKLKKW